MVDPKGRFVFVHVPKTGGQSVSSALRKAALSPGEQVVQRVLRHLGRAWKYDHYGLRRGGGHGTAREIREAIGAESYSAAYSFAFVRNPWDWAVSLHAFEQQSEKRAHHDLARDADLATFLGRLRELGVRTQSAYLTDADGTIMVDRVGRFERLSEDFAEICDRLGFRVDLGHRNRSPRADYRDAHSAASRALVGEMYAEDIDRFGYTF